MKSCKRVTLEDIAKAVDCSKSVVSRAIHNKYGVSEATRNRIYIAALELGYDFDSLYSSTRKKRRTEIGYISILITKVNLLDDRFYGQMVCGIENVLNAQNLNFGLNIVETMHYQDMIDILRRSRVSGVIIIGLVSYKNVAEIICNGIPVVLLDTMFNNLKVDRVTLNNYNGAREAAEYLFSNGHRNIAFWGDAGFSSNFADRYRGIREFCEEISDNVRTDLSVIGECEPGSDIIADEKQIKKVLEMQDRPTAVICATDQIGFKLYDIAHKCGLSIPEDLSVIGFGNNDQCDRVDPRLTSVDIPKYLLGQEAADLLIKRIKNSEAPPLMVQMEPKLIIRDSVRDISKTNNK
jgi:LacI family transcriptional regulator